MPRSNSDVYLEQINGQRPFFTDYPRIAEVRPLVRIEPLIAATDLPEAMRGFSADLTL